MTPVSDGRACVVPGYEADYAYVATAFIESIRRGLGLCRLASDIPAGRVLAGQVCTILYQLAGSTGLTWVPRDLAAHERFRDAYDQRLCERPPSPRVRRMAARGMHCVLVARRQDRLQALAQELEAAHGTRCEIVSADLSQPRAAQELLAEVDRRGIAVELLVNNAGFGMVSAVEETDIGRALELIQVNVTCLTELTLSAAKEMVRRGHGGIINIGSIVSFQPVAYMGVYAASKAYVLHFSEALWAELRPRGVTVTTLCPGTTRTEFFDHSGVPGWAERKRGQDVQTVVSTGLAALDAGRQYVISGWMNYLVSLAVRLATRATVVEWSLSIFRPRRGHERH